MDKRIYLAIVGVAVVAAAIWLSTRLSDAEADSQSLPIAGSTDSVAPGSAVADPGAEHAHATAQAPTLPDSSVEAAPPPGSPPQVSGQSLPLDVSPGFEFLSKPAAEMKDTDYNWPAWRRHQQLQSEPRDETWAPRMEAAIRKGIRDSLIAHGHDPTRIELPVIECRTNGCEIQALGYEMDNAKQGLDMQFILPALLTGPLAGEFDLDAYSMMLTGAPGQRVAFLAQLPRKKP